MGELSTQQQNDPIPENWIERIFTVMSGRYGSKFTDAWRGTDPKVVKSVWADDLAGFAGDEIKRGLDACRDRDWPPTCPEFRKLCRPPIDYYAGYHEALTMMRYRNSTLRAENDREHWTNAAFFWAAVAIGSDLAAMSYDRIEKRWQTEVDKAISGIKAGELSETVPRAPERLPAPERISAAHPRVQAMLDDLLGRNSAAESSSTSAQGYAGTESSAAGQS